MNSTKLANNQEKSQEILYITPKRFKFLIRSIQVGQKFRIHPFRWNYSKQRAEYVRDPTRLFVWYCNIVIIALYVSFLVFQAIRANLDETVSLKRRLLIEFGAILYMFPLAFQLTFLFQGEEYPAYINQFLAYIQELQARRPLPSPTSGKIILDLVFPEVIPPGMWYAFPVLGFMMTVMSILTPRNPIFLSSLLAEPNAIHNLPFRIFSTLFVIFMAEQYHNATFMLLIPNVVILFPFLLIIKVLRIPETNPKRMRENVKLYRQLELLIAKFNRIHGPLLLPFAQTILMLMCIYGFVGMLKLNGISQLTLASLGVFGYMFLFLVLRGSAEACVRSEKLLRMWRQSWMVDKRVFRTLKPLRACIGSYFFIDIGLILTSIDIIVSNTIGILML